MKRTLVVIVLYFAILGLVSAQSPAATAGKPKRAPLHAWYAPKPDYPDTARDHRWEGSGVYRVHIGADGTVLSAETIRSTGYRVLDDSATKHLLRWRFDPPG